MLPQKNIKVLRKIYDKLNRININWVITGSTAFIIQGIPLKPNDINIQTDKKGAYQIEECFKEFVIEKVCFSSNGKISSYFGRLEIDGIRVEIMGDIQKYVNGIWEERVDLEKYKRYAILDGMKLPVLDLEYEYNAYVKLGRIEKALLLKKYINQVNKNNGQ